MNVDLCRETGSANVPRNGSVRIQLSRRYKRFGATWLEARRRDNGRSCYAAFAQETLEDGAQVVTITCYGPRGGRPAAHLYWLVMGELA